MKGNKKINFGTGVISSLKLLTFLIGMPILLFTLYELDKINVKLFNRKSLEEVLSDETME